MDDTPHYKDKFENVLNDRAKHLLKLIIEQHIQHGQPVASKTLAGQASVGLSAATIRSVMADLEEHGYLQSPHTSAGRVPTQQAYRFFVNTCLSMPTIDKVLINTVQKELSANRDAASMLKSTSQILSQMTRLVAVASLPKAENMLLRHVEFLPLSDLRVLVILVVNQHEVHNKIIQLEEEVSSVVLKQVGNYLTSKYSGVDLESIREFLLNDLQHDKCGFDAQMSQVINSASHAFSVNSEQQDLLLEGQGHLLDLADIDGINKLKKLFHAFTQKRQILSLFDQCLVADGVQIFIGEEAGFEAFANCSMVSAPYRANGQNVGVVGVIGPSRMSYQAVIPIVELSAKLLSGALNS